MIVYTSRVDRALEFGRAKHGGSLDDEGMVYFEAHCFVVADLLSLVSDDEDLIIAGLLHDVLEDTDTIYDELVKVFGLRVAGLVLEVTHEGQKDHKGFYFPHLKTKDGIVLKFADRLSNLSRMGSWSKSRQLHYLGKSKFWKSELKK